MIDGVVQNLRAQLGGPVGENLQPTQSTQDSEPTMTKSFMQEFDFMLMSRMSSGVWDFHNLKPLFEGERVWEYHARGFLHKFAMVAMNLKRSNGILKL
ncbi:unnamed protein product [Prunus armeniaca]|uniref:Uncharacterized protein n=1 Tax=Prunus armeniaca TaxID=36596 RepID=A0A6J5VBH9_PRUAR|nr:unnamed protein product [Prunus armeniaca]